MFKKYFYISGSIEKRRTRNIISDGANPKKFQSEQKGFWIFDKPTIVGNVYLFFNFNWFLRFLQLLTFHCLHNFHNLLPWELLSDRQYLNLCSKLTRQFLKHLIQCAEKVKICNLITTSVSNLKSGLMHQWSQIILVSVHRILMRWELITTTSKVIYTWAIYNRSRRKTLLEDPFSPG